MFEKEYYVYIFTTKIYGTLFTGVTSDLIQRVNEYRENDIKSFTQKYTMHRLVYFEVHGDIHKAILREKQIKKWHRALTYW